MTPWNTSKLPNICRFCVWLFFLYTGILNGGTAAAQDAMLTGVVTDASTRQPLADANVFVPALRMGTISDGRGEYRLALPRGSHEVHYSYIGYESQIVRVDLDADATLNVALAPRAELDRVDVVAEGELALDAPVLGISRLQLRDLERLPTLMGEVDVTRSLVMLPGVTTVGEGSGGLHVRGGEADQNLVLLDGMQMFFPSHLFGMFSAFNPDLLESVTMYRGTIPARYGGRISSVVSVRQRDGRGDRLSVSGGTGFVASRVAIEGPLAGERLTGIIGARISHVDWLIRLADRADLKDSSAGYYDLTGQIYLRASDRLQARLSGYLGADSFRFGADTTYNYDSRSLALRTTYAFSRPLSAAVELAASSYRYGFDSEDPLAGFDLSANIEHLRAQPMLIWAPADTPFDATLVEGGFAIEHYSLLPASLQALEGSVRPSILLEREQGLEMAAYLGADIEWGRWRVDGGLRYASWATLGPGMVPVIDRTAPRGPAAIVDTLFYESGEVTARYAGLEPRLGIRFAVSDAIMLKAGFSRLRQNVHLLSNTTAPTPIARWKLSDPNLPAQIGDQVSAGLQTELPHGFRLTAEGYYRLLEEVPTYRPGASLLLNPFVTADLLSGDGRAYGGELLIERPRGMFTGSLSYTIARSERRAISPRPEEQVNLGRYFPADFDRPHDLAVIFSYNESAWATWGINFVYSSGRPLTQPTGVYDLGDLVIPSYSLRNQARLPAYHRMDLSLTIDAPHIPRGTFRGRWNVTIYNIYARRNAYSVFFRQRPGTRIPQAYRVSTFGTIMPSVSYSFEF